jgi:hypothetical protein
MNWTTEKPDLPGYYWFLPKVSIYPYHPEPVQVLDWAGGGGLRVWSIMSDADIPLREFQPGHWLGPIEVPGIPWGL